MIGLSLILAFAAQADGTGASGVPFGQRTRQEARYDAMYDCYVSFMEAKGFDIDTPDRKLKRWDKAARADCAIELRRYRAVVGARKADADWNGVWEDYWSRL